MDQLQIVQNFTLPGSICRKSALDWSQDNKIAVCTSKGTYVMSSHCSPIETGFPLPLHKQVILPPTEPLDFKFFDTFPNKNLGRRCSDALYETVLDHTLMHPKDPQFLGYKCAKWSPKGASDDGSCLLATLTMDHRLVLHREKDREWDMVCDLSLALYDIQKTSWNHDGPSESRQSDDDDDEDYDDDDDATFHPGLEEFKNEECMTREIEKLKARAYAVAPMEFTWTNMFSSSAGTEPSSKWCYLVVAMKSGSIVWWKVSPDDPKVVSFVHEWNPHLGLLTSLCWQQTGPNCGLLLMGSLSGILCFAPVNVRIEILSSAIAMKPICKLWTKPDQMKVDNISILKMNLKKHIVIATKQHFLISCEIMITDLDIEVKGIGHSVGIHKLPITGLSVMDGAMPQSQLLMSSMGGLLVKTKINTGPKGIDLQHEQLQIDLDLKNNMIQGIGVSPNGVLGALILKTAVYYDHLVKREPNQFIMFFTKAPEQIFSEFSQVLKPQFDFLPTAVNNIYKYTDYLECARIVLAMNDKIPELFGTLINWTIESYDRLSHMELYFIRFLLKCFLSELAENIPFNKKDLIQKLDAIETVIMRKYISKVVSSCHNRIDELSPAQRQSLLLMADWLYIQFETSVNNLYEAFGYDSPSDVNAIPPRETCRICQLPVQLSNIKYGECERKHKFGRCCQSLILCDVTPYYQCFSCKSMALEDVWNREFVCTYCSLPMTR